MTDGRNFDETPDSARPPPAAKEAQGSAPTPANDALEEAPLIALAGGLAAGALIAALLPRTRTEERLVRPVANRAKETAKTAAQAAKEAGRSRLNELGLTPDKGKDAVRTLLDGARDAARASAQAAAGSVRGGE